MGRPNKMIVLCTLIIVVILVCVSLDVSYQELGRSTFLEGVLDSPYCLYWENCFQREGAKVQLLGTLW
jgi:hypothetical protein